MEGESVLKQAGRVELMGACFSSHTTMTSRERQAADVFSESLGDDIFLHSHTDDATDLCKKLEKYMIKETRLWWDISTLENYLKSGRIPRGLRIRKFPTFTDVTRDFVESWNKILSTCSERLMELIVSFHSEKHKMIQSDIKELQSDLLKQEAQIDVVNSLDEIRHRVNKMETEIKRSKREKFLRDKMDYELNRVYDWNIRSKFASVRPRYPSNKSYKKKNQKKVHFNDQDNYTSDGSASSSSYLHTEGDFSPDDLEEDNRGQEKTSQKNIQAHRERVKTRSQPGGVDSGGIELTRRTQNYKRH
ncbi:hypothetical protein XELAEV_18029718mg [Xenopus laevis]|uniref:Uncharacterized protein n=1 Tax=Xenopus laevis TaxID=8355 RepID=A0A974CTW6_XENLA|nr:hypothetical protein XELAEV_18029718mg [Xenopus laevis]